MSHLTGDTLVEPRPPGERGELADEKGKRRARPRRPRRRSSRPRHESRACSSRSRACRTGAGSHRGVLAGPMESSLSSHQIGRCSSRISRMTGIIQDAFDARDEIVGFLERYAARFDVPVQEGVEVRSLHRREQGGFPLETSSAGRGTRSRARDGCVPTPDETPEPPNYPWACSCSTQATTEVRRSCPPDRCWSWERAVGLYVDRGGARRGRSRRLPLVWSAPRGCLVESATMTSFGGCTSPASSRPRSTHSRSPGRACGPMYSRPGETGGTISICGHCTRWASPFSVISPSESTVGVLVSRTIFPAVSPGATNATSSYSGSSLRSRRSAGFRSRSCLSSLPRTRDA